MTIDDWNKWLTLLANLGVVAGIVFLAFEVRQNNELLLAQGRAIGEENRMRLEIEIMQNPTLREVLVKSNLGQDLTEEEALLARVFMSTNFNSWQATWLEFEAGLIEIDSYIRQWHDLFHSNDMMPVRWQDTRHRYDPEFAAWMDEHIVAD